VNNLYRTNKIINLTIVALALFIFSFTFTGCGKLSSKPELKTEYQALLLNGGLTYFGKAEIGSEYITLREVYYIQRAVSQDTKEVKNILVKRGQEWHAPDVMFINAREVILIEPVAPDSQVAKLIQEAKTSGTKK
jgi:hypothetical protein